MAPAIQVSSVSYRLLRGLILIAYPLVVRSRRPCLNSSNFYMHGSSFFSMVQATPIHHFGAGNHYQVRTEKAAFHKSPSKWSATSWLPTSSSCCRILQMPHLATTRGQARRAQWTSSRLKFFDPRNFEQLRGSIVREVRSESRKTPQNPRYFAAVTDP